MLSLEPLPSSVTVGKLLSLSGLQFLMCEVGVITAIERI